MRVARVSAWYETEAETVDGTALPDEPSFINGAAEIRTGLGPLELLEHMLATEEAMGRPCAHTKGAARTVDLDLLLFDAETLITPSLTLPHPALGKRVFVLRPLCDIAPEAIEPVGGKTVRTLLADRMGREKHNKIEIYRGSGR